MGSEVDPTGGANSCRRLIRSQSWRSVQWPLKLSGKRPVRTSMRGVVGGGDLEVSPYPD